MKIDDILQYKDTWGLIIPSRVELNVIFTDSRSYSAHVVAPLKPTWTKLALTKPQMCDLMEHSTVFYVFGYFVLIAFPL